MVGDLELVRLLQRKVVDREPFPSFVHEADAYSAAPAELVRGREHGPGDGKENTWYICSPANCHESAAGGFTQRRVRQVGGGAGGDQGGAVRCWHQESGTMAILDPDKKRVGAYKRTLYYVSKIKDPSSGAGARFKKKRLGWCMVEIGLEQKDPQGAGQQVQLVICKVYKSPRSTTTDPETSTAAAAAAIEQGHDEAAPSEDHAGAEAPTVELGREEVAPDEHAGAEAPPIQLEREEVALDDPAGAEVAPIELGREEVALEDPGGAEPALIELGHEEDPSCSAAVSRLPSQIPRRTDAAAALEKGKAVVVAEEEKPTVVMKFGGSSLPSAEAIKTVANLVRSSTEDRPVVVLSAMKTTTTNILMAAEKAIRSVDAQMVCEIDELKTIKDLHLRTVNELGLDGSTASTVLGVLGNLVEQLKSISMKKELPLWERYYLASLGGRLSAVILSAFFNKLGTKTRQYDALDVDLVTTKKCMDIPETYSAIAKRLQGDWVADRAVVTPIVVGFLGKGWKTCGGTTFGRGGTDLAAAAIGRALGSREIQIWKDVDGVLTCDPNIYANAKAIPYLTFDEADELAYFGEQMMRPAREGGITVRVRNLYNAHRPGTLITETRDMFQTTLTGIVLESNITMLHIESTTRKLGQYGFQANVVSILEAFGVSMDYIAINKGKISLALDSSKMSSRKLIQPALDDVVGVLQEIAVVRILQHRSVVSLIGNEQMSPFIFAMARAFQALRGIGVKVQTTFQGLSDSKVMKLSLVVNDSEAQGCVGAVHAAFLEDGFVSEVDGVLESSSVAASGSGIRKRKADDGHPETPHGVRQQRTNTAEPSVREETGPQLSSDNGPSTVGDLPEYFNSIVGDEIPPVNVDYDLYPSPEDIDEMARGLFLHSAVPSEQSVEAMLAEVTPEDLLGSATGSTFCPPSAFF